MNGVAVVAVVIGGVVVAGGLCWLVVATALRLPEPRAGPVPPHRDQPKKPLVPVKPADLGVDVAPRLKTLKVSEPPGRKAGIKVADVATLVDKLKNEAKVV